MTDSHRSLGRRAFLASTLLAAGSAPVAAGELPRSRRRQSESPRTLEIVATETAELYYRFAVEGTVNRTRTSEKIAASEGNDAIVGGIDQSTHVVRGFTGNPGYGDAYEIDGDVFSFTRTAGSSDFFVRLDGDVVSVDELDTGEDPLNPSAPRHISRPVDGTFEVVATEAANLYYQFTVEGTVERTRTSEKVAASESNDAIVGGIDQSTHVVRGFTGNPGYGDAYEIDGELRTFRKMGGASDFYVRLDGQRYDVDELTEGDGSLDAEVACYHSAASVDAEEYDRVRFAMTDSYSNDGTVVEFDDGYAGETTFGYAGDHAVTDGDVTFDEFRGALREVTVVRGDRSRTFSASENVPDSEGVPLRQLLDVTFDASVVDPVISGLGPCELTVEFADGAAKTYAHDMGSERFGSPGRVADAVDFTRAPDALPDFGVRVPNRDPADEPPDDPAVRFDCDAATIAEREFVNRYLGTPDELTVALTFRDGARQERTFDDPSFPVTVRGRGDHEGEAIRRLRASDRSRRVLRVPNPSAGDC